MTKYGESQAAYIWRAQLGIPNPGRETSMTDKHTPGPWFVRRHKHVIEIDNGLESPDYRHITNALPWQDGGPTDGHGVSLQVLADAHLIAAAPELLEALEAIHKRATPRSQDFLHPTKEFADDIARLAHPAIEAAKGDA